MKELKIYCFMDQLLTVINSKLDTYAEDLLNEIDLYTTKLDIKDSGTYKKHKEKNIIIKSIIQRLIEENKQSIKENLDIINILY